MPSTIVNSNYSHISRRDFLKLAALGMGGLAFPLWNRALFKPEFPEVKLLGRINAGKVDIKIRPDVDSQTVKVLYEDAVIPWLREGLGQIFEPVKKATEEATPLHRVATPEDIAQVVLSLIESADFVTGQTIAVDGGNSIRQ